LCDHTVAGIKDVDGCSAAVCGKLAGWAGDAIVFFAAFVVAFLPRFVAAAPRFLEVFFSAGLLIAFLIEVNFFVAGERLWDFCSARNAAHLFFAAMEIRRRAAALILRFPSRLDFPVGDAAR
jgi:hypothetical protein